MTFEEFFIKKKIDLRLLKDVEPNLYKEFQSHYALMGEKSFDHTKKFWFNRLRKSFRLGEEVNLPKATAVSSSQTTEETSHADNSSLAQKTTKPTGFKPRFKAAEKSTQEKEESKENTPEKEQQTAKPVGFKPRFKANQSTSEEKINEENTAQSSIIDTPETPAISKPSGFKPRFKPGITNKEKTEKAENEQTEEAKPLGFKPRFKAGITKSTSGEAESKATAPENKEEPPATERAPKEGNDNLGSDQTVAKKPLGFTPRFKAKGSSSKDESKGEE